MGDVFEGVGDLEVGVEGRAGRSSHLVAGRRGEDAEVVGGANSVGFLTLRR